MAEDLLEFLDRLDEIDSYNEPVRRPRILRSQPNLFERFDDIDFFKRYRLNKTTALWILDKIVEDLEYTHDRNNSTEPMNQLLITLRFYATGTHQLAIADLHGVSISTVSRIVKRVTSSIVQRLRHQHIKMPATTEEIQNNQRAFYEIARFPYVIGTVDCTHVKIQSPGGEDAEIFRNRKGFFSINCQTISDANLKVQNIVVRWPCSTHDSAIFTNSRVCHDFELGTYGQALLLGDSGYPLKDYLITPYLNPITVAQENFNKSQIKTRNTVERQYGVLKRRFPALAMGLRVKLETACNIIVACCILHNICVDFNENLPPIPEEIGEENLRHLIEQGQINNRGRNMYPEPNALDRRSLITHNFFAQ